MVWITAVALLWSKISGVEVCSVVTGCDRKIALIALEHIKVSLVYFFLNIIKTNSQHGIRKRRIGVFKRESSWNIERR